MGNVDVLVVMTDAAEQLDSWAQDSGLTKSQFSPELRESRAAVAELIAAQRMAHDAMLLADWNVPGKVSERKHAAYLASAAALARVKAD